MIVARHVDVGHDFVRARIPAVFCQGATTDCQDVVSATLAFENLCHGHQRRHVRWISFEILIENRFRLLRLSRVSIGRYEQKLRLRNIWIILQDDLEHLRRFFVIVLTDEMRGVAH